MSTPNRLATTPDLILEGWHHLRLQRPLAAWASWQRALRARPDDNAALDALERLANAPELPAVARLPCRFLPASPHEPTRRARWDARLPTVDLDDLSAAATAFSDLADADPTDAEARFNQALCLAWIGRNAEAVGALDQTVAALAADEPAKAADAWCLAEVLRLGAGAETLADDFRYTWDLNRADAPPLLPGFFESWPNLAPVVIPADPLAATESDSGAVGQAFEWLDRPIPPLGFASTRAADLPRVLASVVATPRIVRLSSPDPTGFDVLDEPAFLPVARVFSAARRERTPLAIAWADVALGTYKLPPGLSPAARADLTRATVEHHLENRWIHQPRLSLEHRTPLEAATLAARGDAAARVKLMGSIQFREQLGSRPSHSAVYLAYPFDRLRRRLGLLRADESAALEADDLSCASGVELDALDLSALDDHRLVAGFVSAHGLRDDARTARYAAELSGRGPQVLAQVDLADVFAPLVRAALRVGDPEEALSWLARARALSTGPAADTFAVWSAEVLARTGSPDAALQIYQDLLAHPDATAALALDGAETLLDNGHGDHALPLILDAHDRARASADLSVLRKTEILLRRR